MKLEHCSQRGLYTSKQGPSQCGTGPQIGRDGVRLRARCLLIHICHVHRGTLRDSKFETGLQGHYERKIYLSRRENKTHFL